MEEKERKKKGLRIMDHGTFYLIKAFCVCKENFAL